MKKRCFLNRRGYFFLIDSVLALTVLAMGAFLIFSLYANVPSQEQPSILSDDIMDFFANNKIKDIDNPYAGLGGELWNLGLINNSENTLLQQLAEFYERSKVESSYLDIAEKFIINLTENSLPPQYTFEFWVDGTRIYPLITTPKHNQSKIGTDVLIPSKKIAFGVLDKGTGDMFGPYSTEVLVWK